MPTFATDEELQRIELERRTREAWGVYSAAITGLEGKEYEEREASAWEQLQRRLSEIAR